MKANARRCFAAALLLTCFQGAVGAAVQDTPLDGERERRRLAYLERSPWSDEAFEALLAGLDPLSGRPALEARLAERLAAEPTDLAARVLLARLAERDGRGERALELLDEVDAPPAELRVLAAGIAARAGDFERALEWTAIEWEGAPRALAERALRERARAWAELGQVDVASEELERLLAAAPGSALLALEVASLAESFQMHEAAARFHARAAELATDPAARARALAGAARALERLGRVDEALDACARAAPLVGRGHWLADELAARQLALHERAGTLAEWLDELRAAVTAAPGDAGAREALAVALEGAGRVDEAARALGAAVAVLPDDLALSRRRRRLARLSGDAQLELDELARIAARRPADRELGFELASAYAVRGRVEAAGRRFDALAAGRADDAGFFDRVAAAWDVAGRPEQALLASERALNAAPDDVLRHLEHVARLERARRPEDARAAWSRAERALALDPGALAELARARARRGEREEALRVLDRALALAPKDASLRRDQGDWLEQLGRTEEARQALRAALELARTPSQRDDALVTLLRLAERLRDTVRFRRIEERRLAEDGESLAARLLSAALCESLGEPGAALEHLRAARAAFPRDEGVALALARTLERADRDLEALDAWAELIELAPARRRAALRAMHRLHARNGQRERAAECLEDARRDARRSPDALLELAIDFERLGFRERARECVERAARLAPEEAGVFLRLASLCEREGDREGLRRALVAAWKAGEGQERARAARRLDEWAMSAPLPISGLATLHAGLGRDRDGALLMAELFVRAEAPAEALAALDPMLRRHPFDAGLLQARAAVLLELERGADAAFDLERALALPDAELDALRELHLRARLMTGELDRALEIADALGDAVTAAERLIEADEQHAAEELLRRDAAREPGASASVARLVELYEADHRHAAALEALEELGRRRGLDGGLLQKIGDHALELDRKADALEAGRRWVAREGFQPEARAWFASAGLQREWARLRLEQARRLPLDAAAISAFFEEAREHEESAGPGLVLVAELSRALERGELPVGQTPVSWRRALAQHELALYRASGTRRLERMEDLRAAIASGRELDEREWLHLLLLERVDEWQAPTDPVPIARALEEHPRSELLLAVCARRYDAVRERALATACWTRLAARLALEENRVAEAVTRADESQAHLERVKRWLPTGLRAATGHDALREFAALSARIVEPQVEREQLVPGWDEAVRSELLRMPRGPAVAARFAARLGQAGDGLEHASWLAALAFELGLVDEASAQVERLLAVERAVFALGTRDDAAEARGIASEPWSTLAQRARAGGSALEGMRLLQRAGRRRAALAFVARNDLYDQLDAELQVTLHDARSALAAGEPDPEARRTLRDAVFTVVEAEMLRAPLRGGTSRATRIITRPGQSVTVKSVQGQVLYWGRVTLVGSADRGVLAAVPLEEEAPARARAALEGLLALVPDDLTALRAIAAIAEHQGSAEQARQQREQIIARCAAAPVWLRDELVNAPRIELPWKFPVHFAGAGRISSTMLFGTARAGNPVQLNCTHWNELEAALGGDPLDPGVDLLALFRLSLAAEEAEATGAALARLQRARPDFVRAEQGALGAHARGAGTAANALPSLRVLARAPGASTTIQDLLVLALDELGERAEADELLRRRQQ